MGNLLRGGVQVEDAVSSGGREEGGGKKSVAFYWGEVHMQDM